MAKNSNKPLGFNELVMMSDRIADAEKALASFGKTDLYSTGYRVFDDWLGGGFGKHGAFESVVILGDPGLGKSTLAMQLLKHSVEQGVRQAWAIMEDDHAEAVARFINLYDDKEKGKDVVRRSRVELMSQSFVESDYTLANITEWIEDRADDGINLFLLDNLQFAFDDANLEGKAMEEHRRFMKKINVISKRRGLTTILISHTNKNPAAKGMNRILGSSAIAQVATKVIELDRPKNSSSIELRIHKNRYAPLDLTPLTATRNGFGFDIKSGGLGGSEGWPL